MEYDYIEYPTHWIYKNDTIIIKYDFNKNINLIKFYGAGVLRILSEHPRDRWVIIDIIFPVMQD